MRVIRHQDPAEFSRRVLPLLLAYEAVNNWLVGLLTDLCAGTRTFPREQLLLFEIQENDGHVLGAGASTGESMVLTQMNIDALRELKKFLQTSRIALPKTSGPALTSSTFASLWAQCAGLNTMTSLRATIMQLESVKATRASHGTLRQATADDVDILAPWAAGFCSELGMEPGNPNQDIRVRIERKRLYVWCDPDPVSMAATAGPTPSGIRINFVYTPPEFRRRGYARAGVAALSQMMLDSGKRFVFLFVDADNPSTNSLYRQIGYLPVGDWEDWRFERRDA